MAETYEPVETMDLIGGETCLDFVNTASRRGGHPDGLHDRLSSYADLVTWAERTGATEPAEAARIRSAAEDRPEAAEAVLERARLLRESIYAVFSASADGTTPPAQDVARLDAEFGRAVGRRHLGAEEGAVDWVWHEDGEPLEWILGPIAVSAVELLLSDHLDRVRECGNDECNWLFVDASRNRSRRWCDMRECGNRAKARRHYARQARKRKRV